MNKILIGGYAVKKLEIGKKYLMTEKLKRNKIFKRECTLIDIYDRFALVDFGNYKETIPNYKFNNGEVQFILK